MDKRIRIGALISGGGTNLQAIIDGCETGRIDGEMVFVGSDNPEAAGLKRAIKHRIPAFSVDYETILQNFKTDPEKIPPPRDFDLTDLLSKQSIFSADAAPKKINAFFSSRAIAEARLLAEMKAFPFDVLVLAGFMRVLTPYFIDRINTHPGHFRIMNIHPALLPSFPGTDGYGDTYRYGCKIGGCTVHFVDYGEDSGPIIGQKAFEVDGDDTIETIKKKGLKLEWELYPQCIQLFAEGRLKIVNQSYRLKNGKKATKTVVKVMPPQPDM